MNNYQKILNNLKEFIKRFYKKMLLKGVLLFVAIGVFIFFVVFGVEYFLWLSSLGRLVLLLIFIVVELVLFFKYIATPLFYLLQIKSGITNKDASLLIGKHFPEVKDRLFNLLDLAEDEKRSELLLASIEHRSESLSEIPFSSAVNYLENLRYVKYLALPFLVFVLMWFSGNLRQFWGSYERVINFDLAYEKPAPFRFKLHNLKTEVLESESYTIYANIEGDIRPDVVFIVINGKQLLMNWGEKGFYYTFTPPIRTSDFFFTANGVNSKNHTLKALKTPIIQRLQLELIYPSYLNRTSSVLKGTGNAILPEGTKVNWSVVGTDTDTVHLLYQDKLLGFQKAGNKFQLSKKIYSNLEYQIATSNENVKHYEKLDYAFDVIKDEYPKIQVKQIIDSLEPNISYYTGVASDDYILNSIRLVYYPHSNPNEKQHVLLLNPNNNYREFYYTFPSGLTLEKDVVYGFYFEAVDNDAIHGGKLSKSQVFITSLLDADQLNNKQLEFQENILENMDKSLENFKKQKEALEDLSKEQKEKNSLNFNDKNQVKDLLKKQEQQESLMQKYSKQLKENLNNSVNTDEENKLLKERLERQELAAKNNEDLLKELQKVADKINKEELTKRLEDIGKKQKNSERNLEQLLELTKRYYITEKASQLAKDLEKLAKEQEVLSEKEIKKDFNPTDQDKLNDDFNKIALEIDELIKDNELLKEPLDFSLDKDKEEGVKQDQKEALEQIKKHESPDEPLDAESKEKASKIASQKQKSAASKMKEMAAQMQKSSAGSGGEASIAEDADMLRQILDNLITFSFKQESLYNSSRDIDENNSQFSQGIRKQQELRNLFEHVDDSLFALSLRRAELSEFVNEQITEVYYNIDKTLENMAESRLSRSLSHEKYVIGASNSLSNFLARILENMQQSMQMGEGEGQGQDFQLPDIIKGQGDLQKKMEQLGKSGQEKPGEGSKGQEGEGNKPGEGKEGESGKEGELGNEGESGKGVENGKGKHGKNGRGIGNGEGNNGNQGQGQPSEEELQELYEIYKEQQLIRQQLENQLNNMINKSDQDLAKKLIQQMENFENDLLENGVTQRTQNKVNTIKHQLLKLENAALKQGIKNERESSTNSEKFQNPITTKPAVLDDYNDEIEILNRQELPLLQNYRNKVKQYFRKHD